MTSYIAPDFTDRPLVDLVSLQRRVAVVTGGAQGIGASIAFRLAEAGATVVIADLNAEGANMTAREIQERTGSSVSGIPLDVTDEDAVQDTLNTIVEKHGKLDILINNAGIYPPTGDPKLASGEHLQRVMDVNVTGTFLASREAAKVMLPGAVIVNVVSTAGFRASRGTMAYITSKHAVAGLTKSLALELGQHGVRVTGVAPEATITPGVLAASEALRKAGYESGRQSLNLFGRRAVPDDIARVVLFLASDLSSWMTGSVIAVDAGRVSILG